MGTSWDIYCLDCDEDANVHANYDPIHQSDLLPILEIAKSVGSEAENVSDLWVISEGGPNGPSLSIKWLARHGKHSLRLKSEYGEVEGQCSKYFTCEHCGAHRGYCDKDVDHGGKCGKR